METLVAEKLLDICQKTAAIFRESVRKDRDVRNAVLTHKATFEQMSILKEGDKEFDEVYRELIELSYRYSEEYEKRSQKHRVHLFPTVFDTL